MKILIYEEVDVIKLPDGAIIEIHNEKDSIHNYKNAILIEKYFHAKYIEKI